MNENYSKLLNNLIERATVGQQGKKVGLTYERFFAALIDAVMLHPFSEEDASMREEAWAARKALEEYALTNWQSAFRALRVYGQMSEDAPTEEGIERFGELLGKAREGLTESEVLTVPRLLKTLLRSPTRVFSTCVPSKTSRSTSALEASIEAEFAKAAVSFAELFGQKDDGETDAARTPEQAHEAEPKSAPADGKEMVSKIAAKVKEVQDTLLAKVYGQDNAVSVFASGYFQAELLSLTDKSRKRPRATYLFAGPPGVGKTFLAECAAEALGLPFMRFDMSEYSVSEASVEFCGSDKVYKNGKPGNVTGFVEEHPKCVLLFDEIEKADISVIHLFLQMLDAGRLRDNFTDTEVPFTDTIIIFTTNAGKELYADPVSGDLSGVSRKVILKALARDTNPKTGVPYFPAALCSRFASGNVVMFNHISAHDLREIAKKEILRHVKNFEREIGIKTVVDEDVFTALLLSEGGAADARTIRARAEAFLDDELYELFRLLSSEKYAGKIGNVESIRIGVTLPRDGEIRALFSATERPQVLVFADGKTAALCREKAKDCDVFEAQTVEAAKAILQEKEIKVVLIDPKFGQYKAHSKYLNPEDEESVARDFFMAVRESLHGAPVYLLQTAGVKYTAEERLSFTKAGIRGILPLSGGRGDTFARQFAEVCRCIHQQDSMIALAKSNKLLTFATAQTVSRRGAEIMLFDLKLSVALEAEDSRSILSGVSKPSVRFDAVIGADDAKRELRYFVEYLKNPKKYLGTGVRAPKGVLLYGPPGTGKTMLAKAMACESDVTFIVAEGNQFLKKYVGEGPEKVHELFQTARKYAPSILFVDEIDAMAMTRNSDEIKGADPLTAFLTEMDGFKNDPTKPVFVLAATNFGIDPSSPKSLDPALLRRFDRKVFIDLPTRDDRVKYIRFKMAKNKALALSEGEIENIAVRSTGMSLSELESIIELALRSAIRAGSDKVTDDIFEEAFETYNSGDAKKWDASELLRVARHETGHAFLCYEGGETPSYVTVVARADHGGYMRHADKEGKNIFTKEEVLANIRTSLGGRAAEIVYYGEKDGVSTGASGDLAGATSLAQRMVCSYGMSDSFGLAVVSDRALAAGEMSREVRHEVNKILDSEMERAIRIITENRDKMDRMVEALMEKDHLSGPEIEAIFGEKITL